MRIAIAGATGFLGGSLARALSAHEVVPLPRGAIGSSQVDALVWAAGSRDVESLAGHAVHVVDPVAAIAALRPRRVIYLSSGEVYGDAPLPFCEHGEVRAATPYARAKLAGEAAVDDAARALGATAIALRLSVVYGPGQRPAMLIPQLVRALEAGEPIALTSGEQTRDFLHIDDASRAIALAIAMPAPPRTLNLGSGRETRVRDVCLELARLFDRDPSLLRFGTRHPRTAESPRYALDISLAGRVLGWQPKVSLAHGLAELRPSHLLRVGP